MKIHFLRYISFKYRSLVATTILILVFSTYCLQHAGKYEESIPNEPGCSSPKKIAFLKTYKCGTTTLMSLLLKYTAKAGLTRQEVDTERIRLGPFNRTYVTNPTVKGDYMFDHIIWNRDEVVAQLGPGVVAFTVIRNPYSIFESYYSYTNQQKDNGLDMKGFIQLLGKNDPMKWNAEPSQTTDQIMLGLYGQSIAVNLGMPFDSLQDDKAIDNHIAKIEKELDLVMITERMEESLILFRNLMCWKLEDIVTFDKNVRRASSVATLDDDDKNELKKWLKADEKIYNHFNKIFEDKVAKYPGDIKREIQQRIDAREELRADCLVNHEKNPECHGFNSLVADTRDNLI